MLFLGSTTGYLTFLGRFDFDNLPPTRSKHSSSMNGSNRYKQLTLLTNFVLFNFEGDARTEDNDCRLCNSCLKVST